jgi:hypothetical protein
MNNETVVAQNQHDVSAKNLVMPCALNREQIARPHGGKHAGSPCFEANGTAAAEHLGGEIKPRKSVSFQRVWRRGLQTTSSFAWHGTKN